MGIPLVSVSGLLPPPLWRETRIGLETAALLRDPVWKGQGVRGAGGQPVLLMPGFLAGDDTLGLMTRWLRRTGHQTKSAGIRRNIDCSERAVTALLERTEELAERHGRRIALIGQSRGGTFARVMAVRRPDLISGIVTLGSPLTGTFQIHPIVRGTVYAVGAVGSLGAPNLFAYKCLWGDCCTSFWEDMEAPFPEDVGFTSIYSKSDGIVKWHSCLDEGAKHVEVKSSHIGMAVNAGAYREIARSLEKYRRADRKRVADGKLPVVRTVRAA
jgi:pimeloyl-ACP methyl ester carboxylesterase